jgi:tRNA-dihydrouridine synthase
MVARAAIKRPWVLNEIHLRLATGQTPAEPTVLEKIRIIRLHFDLMRRFRGDRLAMIVMRGRIAAYGASLGHVKPFKERIRLMTSPGEFDAAMDDLERAVDPSWTFVPHWARWSPDCQIHPHEAVGEQSSQPEFLNPVDCGIR